MLQTSLLYFSDTDEERSVVAIVYDPPMARYDVVLPFLHPLRQRRREENIRNLHSLNESKKKKQMFVLMDPASIYL